MSLVLFLLLSVQSHRRLAISLFLCDFSLCCTLLSTPVFFRHLPNWPFFHPTDHHLMLPCCNSPDTTLDSPVSSDCIFCISCSPPVSTLLHSYVTNVPPSPAVPSHLSNTTLSPLFPSLPCPLKSASITTLCYFIRLTPEFLSLFWQHPTANTPSFINSLIFMVTRVTHVLIHLCQAVGLKTREMLTCSVELEWGTDDDAHWTILGMFHNCTSAISPQEWAIKQSLHFHN